MTAARPRVVFQRLSGKRSAHSSLGNQTPLQARRALEQFEGSAPGALAQTETHDYQNQT
jgi:hypothetical protein